MTSTKAHIVWHRVSDQRRVWPPTCPEYSTIARFSAIVENWPNEAWSVVIEIPQDKAGQSAYEAIVGIRLLFPERAPAQLLVSWSTFELYEGHTCVAHGTVL